MTVHFGSVNDVREFVCLAGLQPYSIEVCDGDHRVDAKSFMEMFTIDFTNPLLVSVDTKEHEQAFAGAARKFMYQG